MSDARRYVPPYLKRMDGGAPAPSSYGSASYSSGGYGGSSSGGYGGGYGGGDSYGAPSDGDGGYGGGSRDGGYGGSRGGGSSRYTPYGGGSGGRYGGGGGGGYGGGGYGGRDSAGGPQSGSSYAREDASEEELFRETNQTAGINFDKYDEIPVQTTGRDVPPPVETFAEADIDRALMKNIDRARYTKPTPVQKYALPIVANGRDLMACAQTGSGKTAGFLFPIISRILKEGPSRDANPSTNSYTKKAYPTALILVPTRELATQIYDEARKFCYQTPVLPVVVYGGASMQHQMMQLRKGCHILVATPGRLVDLITRGVITMQGIRFLVLDEADRMLDMGFEPQIRQVVEGELMPPTGQRQTLMYSATFPREIQQLASAFLSNFVFLTVGRVGSTTESITQKIEFVEDHGKPDTLFAAIQANVTGLTLVFTKTKSTANYLERFLSDQGIRAIAIHGDKSQSQREFALQTFKKGSKKVLVATDVAARGLDVNNISHVINYDLPENIDDYVHRIGRTGRAGNTGLATSFFNNSNGAIASDLYKVLEEANQECPDFLREIASSGGGGYRSSGRGRGGYGGGRGGRGGYGGGRGGGYGGGSYGGGYGGSSGGGYGGGYGGSSRY